MRILLLTSEYPPHSWGGLGRYSYEVCNEMKTRFEVDVLNIPSYYINTSNINEEFEPGVRVDSNGTIQIYSKDLINLFNGNITAFKEYSRTIDDLVDTIIEKIGSKKYDIIFVQDYYNILIASSLLMNGFAKKIVSTCHLPLYAGFTYFDKPKSEEFHQFLESILIRFSSKIIVPSSFTKRILIQTYNVSSENIIVNPLGVRIANQEGKDIEGDSIRSNENRNKINIISVIRFTEQKGLHYLLDVIKELDEKGINFRYTVIGSGPREREFYAMAEDLSVTSSIHHIKSVDFDRDIFEFYESSDIYLSTSLYETFGLSILEAMAYRCVPVAFRVGPLGELIHQGVTGFLVDVNDTELMVEHIIELSTNKEKIEAIKKAASNYAKDFTWKRHVDELAKTFEGCLNG